MDDVIATPSDSRIKCSVVNEGVVQSGACVTCSKGARSEQALLIRCLCGQFSSTICELLAHLEFDWA